jgi:tetratricopeptide (TPR) repeat protein
MAILAGLSIAVWQAVVARRQWERAERRSTEVRRLTNTLLKDLQNEIGGLPGSDRAREKLYEVSIEYLNGLARETNDPAVLKQLSEAYVLLGRQYGYENRKPDEIQACILRGLEISRRLVADYPKDLEVKELLAANLEQYDFFCEKEPAAKLKLNEERARLREELVKARPSDGETYELLANAYSTMNYLLNLYERPDEAAGYQRLRLQTREREVQLLDKTEATNLERDLLAGAYIDLGSTYAEESHDLQTAEDYFRRALTVAENLVAEHPDHRIGWVRLAAANSEIGEARYKQGDYQGALDHLRAGLAVLKEATVKLTDAGFRGAEPNYMLRIAKCLYLAGHKDEGLQMLRDAAALNSQLSEFGSTEAATASRNAWFFRASGEVYAALGLKDKALDSYRQAQDLWKKIAGLEPQEQSEADSQIGRLHLLRGDVYAASRDGRETAQQEYQAGVDMLSKLKADNQIGLPDLRELYEAQQKLRASAS